MLYEVITRCGLPGCQRAKDLRDQVKATFESPLTARLVDEMDDDEFIVAVKKLRNA